MRYENVNQNEKLIFRQNVDEFQNFIIRCKIMLLNATKYAIITMKITKFIMNEILSRRHIILIIIITRKYKFPLSIRVIFAPNIYSALCSFVGWYELIKSCMLNKFS